jgi:putative ABC transport system permease protein
MERRPLRTALSIGGIAAAVAVVVMGNFFRDAIDFIVDAQFNVALRGDVQVWLARPADEAVGLELARLPGVRAVEAGRDVPVRLSGGHRAERVVLQGLQAQGQLHRVVSTSVRVSRVPSDGLLLTDRLAARLGVRAGDTLQVEVLEGRRQVLRLPVRATVPEMMGLNAYIDRTALNRLLGEGPRATRFAMQVERGSEPQVLQATRDLPRVVGAFSKATLLRNMEEVSARNVRIMSTVLTLFAVVIAVGVVYNIARIALSERTWELASLRVLGFTRGEVSALLLGEMALGILLALPLGMLLGHGLVHGVVGLMRSDAFDFPVVILPRTYAWAAIAVVAAGAASALVVRRHVDRLDMVAALKTRE